jgi:hypothetical protein
MTALNRSRLPCQREMYIPCAAGMQHTFWRAAGPAAAALQQQLLHSGSWTGAVACRSGSAGPQGKCCFIMTLPASHSVYIMQTHALQLLWPDHAAKTQLHAGCRSWHLAGCTIRGTCTCAWMCKSPAWVAAAQVFEPDRGCRYAQYTGSEVLDYFQSSATDILVVGDSFMRQLFVRLVHLLRGQVQQSGRPGCL